MRKLARAALAAGATVALAAVGVSTAAAPPPTGPIYPLPGMNPVQQAGDNGSAGGVTYTYTGIDASPYDPLMWGVWSTSLPALAMDGEIDEPGESMTYSAADSDPPGGVAVYRGEAELPGAGIFQTRAVVRSLTPDGAPLAMAPAGGLGLDPAVGAAAVLSGDFKSNLILEVWNGSAWVPAKTFFNGVPGKDPGQEGQLRLSTSGGFYYVPANVLPEAAFEWSPQTPTAGRTVSFTSTSTDSDGTIESTDWDLDGDGEFDDASGTSASTVFSEAGEYEVGVRVVDDGGGADTATATVTVVPNELPAAAFSWTPGDPKALQTVTFTSESTDSDGTIVSTGWDLDGDGDYDDASGETAQTAFQEGGEHTVGVRVVDDLGGVSTATETVVVRPCERSPVSQTLRTLGATLGLEPQVRQVNCDVLEPLGL